MDFNSAKFMWKAHNLNKLCFAGKTFLARVYVAEFALHIVTFKTDMSLSYLRNLMLKNVSRM